MNIDDYQATRSLSFEDTMHGNELDTYLRFNELMRGFIIPTLIDLTVKDHRIAESMALSRGANQAAQAPSVLARWFCKTDLSGW